MVSEVETSGIALKRVSSRLHVVPMAFPVSRLPWERGWSNESYFPCFILFHTASVLARRHDVSDIEACNIVFTEILVSEHAGENRE